MKIVVTARDFTGKDRRALNMLLQSGHEVIDYSDRGMGPGTSEEAVIEAVGDADIAIAGLEPYRAALLERCPNLKLISRRGIGYDSVDVDACRRHGVTLARTMGTVEGSVAEHVMAYILHFARRVDLQSESMHRGEWKRVMTPGAKSRTLGLVGFGGIGKEIARRAVPFGMKVLYNCRHPHAEWETQYSVQYANLDALLAQSDYVCIALPLTPDTRGLFDEAMLARIKPGAVLINIARGPIVDAAALARALTEVRLSGAGVDVFDAEPCTDSPLIACPTAVLTPHTAPYTSENFEEMNAVAAQNALDFIAGCLPEKNRVV